MSDTSGATHWHDTRLESGVKTDVMRSSVPALLWPLPPTVPLGQRPGALNGILTNLDGRVLLDQINAWAVSQTLWVHRATLRQLGEVYKQLNAPFGQFGMDTLAISTRAL